MLPLKTKQSGGKLLPPFEFLGIGGVSRGNIKQEALQQEQHILLVKTRTAHRSGCTEMSSICYY
jgi:hypothetical protein